MTRAERAPAWLPLLVFGAGVAHALVLFVRLRSLAGSWRDVALTGSEGPHVYAIWRALEGVPIYERALEPPFSLAIYNVIFYAGYGALLRLGSVRGEELLLAARLVTLAFAVGGAALFAAWLARLLGEAGRTLPRGTLAAFAGITFLGSQTVSFWALAIRPDLPALACAVAGLFAATEALRRERRVLFVAAGLAFAAAWAFKQSTIAAALGVALFLLGTRRFVALALVSLPLGVAVAAALALGTPEYRISTLEAPLWNPLDPARAAWEFARAAIPGVCAFGVGAIGLALASRALPSAHGPAAERETWRMLATVAVVALVLGVLGLARAGGSRNQLFEAHVVLSAGAAWLLANARGTRERALVAAGLVALVAFPLVQLAWPGRVGVLEPGSEARRVLAERVRMLAREHPGRVLVLDEILSQPWNSTGGVHPAWVLDLVTLEGLGEPRVRALADEVVRSGGVELVIGARSDVAELWPALEGCSEFAVVDEPWLACERRASP